MPRLSEFIRRHPGLKLEFLVLTQIKGLHVDFKMQADLEEKYTGRLKEAEKAILETSAAKKWFQAKGTTFRPSANDDVLKLLTDILPESATHEARDRDGVIPNVTEDTLKRVKHDIAKLILHWRKQNKVLTTYIKPVNPESPLIYDDDLAHPVTRTTTTRTWRTSADGPNYQNWPKRDDVRKEVRRQVARKQFKIVSFDYAGIQARNVAMESKDTALVKAFWDRYDIHSDWLERLVRLDPRWVKEGAKELAKDKALFKSYRNRAKNEFVFPSFFGAQPGTVSHYLGVDNEVGKKLQATFWEMFPEVHDWHARLFKQYRSLGYVQALSGFRRRGPLSHNEMINAPIQSDEAVIVCDAMARLSETRDWALQANMEIHDDLTFFWPEADVEKNAKAVIDVMVNVRFKWAHIVPIGVEASMGDNWNDQKAIGEYFSDTWKGNL